MAPGDRPQLIYDGDCELCSRAARWVTASAEVDSRPSEELSGEQLSTLGLQREQTAESLWWIDANGSVRGGHQAVSAALSASPGWRRLAGRILGLPVLSPLARPVYRFVARHRHRLSAAIRR